MNDAALLDLQCLGVRPHDAAIFNRASPKCHVGKQIESSVKYLKA